MDTVSHRELLSPYGHRRFIGEQFGEQAVSVVKKELINYLRDQFGEEIVSRVIKNISKEKAGLASLINVESVSKKEGGEMWLYEDLFHSVFYLKKRTWKNRGISVLSSRKKGSCFILMNLKMNLHDIVLGKIKNWELLTKREEWII